jgi:hypothetical protein
MRIAILHKVIDKENIEKIYINVDHLQFFCKEKNLDLCDGVKSTYVRICQYERIWVTETPEQILDWIYGPGRGE